ncbi:MAG: S-layer homology domain-containing protein [Thermoanaerobaculia bacterium]
MTKATRTATRLGFSVLAILFAGAAFAGTAPKPPKVATTRHAPDEFGIQDYTVTVVGAVSFTPLSDDNSSYPTYVTDPSNFARQNHIFSTDIHYYATASIPSGAVLDTVGLEGACSAPAVTGIAVSLVDRNGNVTPVVAFSCSQHGNLDTDYNATPLGFQLAQNVHNLLAIDVEINDGTDTAGAFSWVELWWKRTVSPPPAVASFDDVPTSHPFFQYIEALKASGITGGCSLNPPLFCPDKPLTRGQMAVFLAKGLGLHWPD